jgi:predicted adenylyl cyclase CyaB
MPDGARYEVERKYRLSRQEYAEMPTRLKERLQFEWLRDVVEADTFLPAEKPGDMIRIRDEKGDQATQYFLTQKTWVEVMNGKERREQEDDITSGVRDCMIAVTERLNAQPLKRLSKKRSFYQRILPEGHKVTIVLDEVANLGANSGNYMEIEILVTADEDVSSARQKIAELAKILLDEDREPWAKSYKQMLDEVWQ